MSNPPLHHSHSEDARPDDAPPTDGFTDEVRQDAAEANSAAGEEPAQDDDTSPTDDTAPTGDSASTEEASPT